MAEIFRLVGARALWAAVTLAVTAIVVFAATQLMPGNVAQMILGTFATPEAIHTLDAKLGLDQSGFSQFTAWFGRLMTGDFGQSLRMGLPIGPIVAERLGLSLVLAGASLFLVFLLGVTLGTIAALRHRRPLDHLLTTVSLVGISMPEFVTGSILILLCGSFLPVSGYSPPSDGIGKWLAHLVLPVTSLTFILLAHVMRTARVSMLDALGTPYVRTAVLKGLPERTVIVKHALRNALLPTVTVIGINVGYLIGGVVVVETVFSYPGIGRLTIFAVQNRDIPLIQACTLTMAVVYIITSFVTDLVYLVLNPRLRRR